MSIVFDPFTGQIIDTGPSGGMAVGGPVAGATPNSVLVVDGAQTLQDVPMPLDGQLIIGSAGNLPVAATLTQASASQVVITNGPGSITLGLPQDISTTDSPEFAGLTLTGFSGPVKATAGVLSASAIDLASVEVTGILPIANGGTNTNSVPTNGQLLIGNGTDYSVANVTSSTLTTNPDRIIITNGSGSIDLDLPQDINTSSSPTFANLNLGALVLGSLETIIDISANTGPADTLNIGITNSDIINIGNAGAQVNIYGTTVYQNVTNLNVADKNITVNVGGSTGSSFNAGIHVEEDVLGTPTVVGYAEVNPLRDGWNFKAPLGSAVANLIPGNAGFTIQNTTGTPFTIDQGSHNPITIATPANGLAVDGSQELSIAEASALTIGVLSAANFTAFTNKVNRAGDTMTGALAMSNNNITGLADPVNDQDAVNKRWIEDQLNDVSATYYDIGSLSLPSSTSYSPDGTTIANGDRVLFAFNNTIQVASGLPAVLNWTADSFVATEGDVVAIKKGDIFGLQFAKFDGTTFQINNYVRYFNGSDYWEQSSPATIAITNNATTEILRIEFLNSENIIADYSLTRGTRKSTGTLHITTDGTDVVVSDTGVDLNLSLGVSFVGSIDGTEIVIECVADNSDAGTMKFMTRRWSDNAGGPAGIPSYATNTGLVVKEISDLDPLQNDTYNNINTIEFDYDTGLRVAQPISGTVRVSLNSTFKTWNIDNGAGPVQPSLVALGEDTVEFIAGSNIQFVTDNTYGSKSFTINATGGGGPTEQTQAISNATTAAFTSYDPALKKGAKIEFALHRFEADGVTIRGQTGRILVISNGASAINIVTDSIDVVGSTGVTFTATYNGLTNEVDINYVSTNVGAFSTGTMSYTVQTWS